MAQTNRVTIDEKFNAEYAKKGLQPSYATKDSRVKKVNVQDRYSAQAAAEVARSTAAANDPSYQAAQPVPPRQPKTVRQPRRQTATKTQKIKKKGKPGSKKIARTKATIINSSLLTWVIPSWLFVQIPIALINLAFFGFSYIYLSIFGFSGTVEETTKKVKGADGVASTVTGWFFEGVGYFFEGINFVIKKLTGFDLSNIISTATDALNPLNIFMATQGLLLGFALFLMLTIGLLYMFAGLKPLSGKGAGLKMGAVILCFIGYFMPILNLFPWILLWTTAVWLNPK